MYATAPVRHYQKISVRGITIPNAVKHNAFALCTCINILQVPATVQIAGGYLTHVLCSHLASVAV